MALGDLTKQLASQAIRNAVNPPPAPPRPDNAATAMMAQLLAMQKALKDDEELVVTCHAGGETIRVHEFYFPTWQVAVLSGVDQDKSAARVVATVEALQLVSKVAKSTAAPPGRIRFVLPKPKNE